MHDDNEMRSAFEEGRVYERQNILSALVPIEHSIGCEIRISGDIDMCDCYIPFEKVRNLLKEQVKMDYKELL